MTQTIPPAFRAAEIALVAIKQNRCTSWAELEGKKIDTRLTDAQLALVHDEIDTVKNLRVVPNRHVTVTYCPACLRIAYISGTVPARCTLTFECPGKPEKASSMAKKPIGAEDTDDELAG